MTEQKSTEVKNIGLRGVTVADTKISHVDGQNGLLIYRGYKIQDLAAKSTFEEITYLLLNGRLPSAMELGEVKDFMAAHRELPPELMQTLKLRPKNASSMAVVQSAISMLADFDPELESEERNAWYRSSLRLISRAATVVSAWSRIKRGEEPMKPEYSLSHSAAFLYGIWGRKPSPDEERLMDILLVLHAEHALNASTFAAREVASTFANLYASVSSAVGALSGPLHGGANARVMQMLLEIGSIDRVESWVKGRIEAGERIMGLGHAVYKTVDPRAEILRDIAKEVLTKNGMEKWLDLCLKVDEVSRKYLKELKGRELYPNVDFYSSPVLYSIGLDIDMFPAFFAVSRTAGWCSHVIEERFAEAAPRPALYRPASNYSGRFCGPSGCRWVPMEQRGAGCPCGKELKGCTEEEAAREMEEGARAAL